ncbi:MAG: GAF domain-containing protein [Candidatus Omnitrophica bacterium]|nr:GAF domain-containing protein [Candidatus Omnitrophota bacterium]
MGKIRSQNITDTKKTLNLSSLDEISRVLGASFDLDRLLNIILNTMLRQTNADSGSLMLLDEERKELYISASKGINEKIARETRIKLGEGISGIVALRKKPLVIDNKTFFSIFGKKPRKNLKSSLSIPLHFSDKLIGVMNLNRVPGSEEFTEQDLEAISLFAMESSIAIHNAKLYIAAEEKIQHLFRFNVISCALNAALNQEKLLDVLNDCMRELFRFDIYTLLLIEENSYHLLLSSHNELSKSTVAELKKNFAMVLSGLKKKPVTEKQIILSTKKLKDENPSAPALIQPRHIQEVINAPIITKGSTLGMLSVYSTRKHGFSQKDQQSLTTLANQAAVAIENTNLYKNLRKTYFSTIKALAQAIEEKDVYTRGHSEMVSYYAVAIAQAMQLPLKLVEGIQIAGILHDIGKIGIPEKILTKPSGLTYQEYEIIKNHPLIGKRILEPVNFFWGEMAEATTQDTSSGLATIRNLSVKALRQLHGPLEATIDILRTTDLSEEIKTMIYHHHERNGGGGYPDGIKGDQIPIGSRILAVADTFEAMTADRPYRKAFPVKKALMLIKKSTPDQLDPKIVKIFTELIKKKLVIVKD